MIHDIITFTHQYIGCSEVRRGKGQKRTVNRRLSDHRQNHAFPGLNKLEGLLPAVGFDQFELNTGEFANDREVICGNTDMCAITDHFIRHPRRVNTIGDD